MFLLLACSVPRKKAPVVYPPGYLARSYEQVNRAKKLIHTGDIIFRNGTDEVSEAARSMNRSDTSYSHCGILLLENDSAWVYHALGGRYNPGMKLLREPIDSFCNPRDNNAFGIYRYDLTPLQIGVLRETVHRHFKNGLKFDMFFNFETDDEMYCSEFVFKSLNHSLEGKLSGQLRLDTIPFGVTTDDIFLNPACHLVKREKFVL
ncbi:MAG: hypothetical protein HYZ15_10150 [Sphingobacteriales bacterium]|nr:hypothetical protein [Sphingobacteriales bacterium]